MVNGSATDGMERQGFGSGALGSVESIAARFGSAANISARFGSLTSESAVEASKIAGSMAFHDGCKKANPVLLEPQMKVEIVVPEQYLGDVIGNINARRGNISGILPRKDAQVVSVVVPLSEMFGYATQLRSISQGRAIYTMQFSHYEPAPQGVASEIIEKTKG